jgi:hypothetical protein
MLKIFNLVSIAIAFGFVAYFGWVMIQDWRTTPREARDTWQEILALGAGSATKVWLRFVALVSSFMTFLQFVIPALQMPEVQDVVVKYLPPERVSAALLGIAVVGLFARGRTSDDDRLL